MEKPYEAIHDFSEVIRINPNHRIAYRNRAFTYRHLANLVTDPMQRIDYMQRAQEDERAAERLGN